MSKIKTPPLKKALRDAKDHYPGGHGESKRAWRRTKQVKKADERRRFRKGASDAVRAMDPESADEAEGSVRASALRQPKVREWGVISVGEFAQTRRRVRTVGRVCSADDVLQAS